MVFRPRFFDSIYIYIYIYIHKQFTLYSAEAYAEPFPTSKQKDYLIRGNHFHKKLDLRCMKRF